jgi:hypothetical protein
MWFLDYTCITLIFIDSISRKIIWMQDWTNTFGQRFVGRVAGQGRAYLPAPDLHIVSAARRGRHACLAAASERGVHG